MVFILRCHIPLISQPDNARNKISFKGLIMHSNPNQMVSRDDYDNVKPYKILSNELNELRNIFLASESEYAHLLDQISPHHQLGARNLIHYLSLRRHDIRQLQDKLTSMGLSSLGRAEANVLQNLQAIIHLLECAMQQQVSNNYPTESSLLSEQNLLNNNTENLFGHLQSERQIRIMVTLPADAANDYTLIKEMLTSGMNCARINCAHDDRTVWLRIIEKIRLASRETGRDCRILMDLGGPKLRTGEISLAPPVLKWKPKRNKQGRVLSPARIWIHPETDNSAFPVSADALLAVDKVWLDQVIPGDKIVFTDARGSHRELQVQEKINNGFWAESEKTAYLALGTQLHIARNTSSDVYQNIGTHFELRHLPQVTETIRLYRGSTLVLTKKQIPGTPEEYNEIGQLSRAARIPCSLPEVFEVVRPGERILFDDGRISGIIKSVHEDEMLVEITNARDTGEKLLADKGINLPDSELKLCGLTQQDIENLEFVVHYADMVGLSFAHKAEDIELLQEHLTRLDAKHFGIVLKVETRAAFDNLPALLLRLMRSTNIGVMIARGDLAVECGYERLAELQEEIMWLSEAAHIPLIWATQVLESLTKNGKPSRAEITDAAMSVRAECVMLNKGPHIIEAIQMLDDILFRMQQHQHKKRSLLRRLHW